MSADADITCREVVELLSSYLDGELPASLRARVEAHLAACDGCTMVVDELRETIRLTGALTEDRLTEAQAATLLAAFRGWAAGA
jgi:anti-sigma factor RsiW